jgi:glycosyltransferase involved in cell wall biosynthesis
MNRRNILMLLDNEFTGDMRVENEVTSLVNAGFNVTVLCLNHGDKENSESFYGATILRIPISLFKKNKMKGLTNTFFDFWKLFWWRKIKKIAKTQEIHFIHAHDLYMVPPALIAKRKLKSQPKVVADLHENYPEALKHYKYTQQFPGKYIISINQWEKKEPEWLNECDQVITVIDEAIERYKNLGVNESKLIVVPNYVNQAVFNSYEKFETQDREHKNHFGISYIGGFDYHRGIDTLITAVHKSIGNIRNIHLTLIGDGSNRNELEELVQKLDMESTVSFKGWVSPSQIPKYLNESDICVIPHLKTIHTDNTIPHKLFQYMMFEKPVIGSSCSPIERIINDSKCGLIYESGNSDDLAEKIKVLYENEELRKEFSKNGAAAIHEKYNWEIGVKSLITFYKSQFN